MKSIAVANGKGGVGKTSIAANLSISLAEHGHKVLLVDADFGLANIDILLGLKPHNTLKHVLCDGVEIADIVIAGPEGVDVVTGGSGSRELANLDQQQLATVVDGVLSLGSKHGFVVFDTASGVGESVMSVLRRADRTVIVSTPDPTSIIDAFATAKVLFGEKPDADVALLVNMADDVAHGQTVFNRFKAMIGQFLNRDTSFAGVVCFDEAVRKATRQRTPFILSFPKSSAARQIDALVEWLVESPEERTDNEAVNPLQRMRQVFAVFKRGAKDEEPESLKEAA